MFRRPKAILSLILAAVMLSSCGAKGSSSDSAGESASEAATTTRAVVTLPQDSSLADGSSQSDENKETSDITPAMWKITADDGHEIYFIGSMHALKDECYPLPDRVTDAYNKSDVVACEMDMYGFTQDLTKQLELANDAMYSDKNETVEQHLSPETVTKLTGFFDEVFGEGSFERYKHYKPWMLASQCEGQIATACCGLDIYLALDLTVTEMATNDGKEIYEIEGADKQFEMVGSIPDEAYDIKLVDYSPENFQAVIDQEMSLYEIWKSGDIESLEKLFNDVDGVSDKYTEEQQKILDEYNHMILIDRNVGMADAAEKLLKEHKCTFFMVGSAHFINDNGIIALLEKRGYKVETV